MTNTYNLIAVLTTISSLASQLKVNMTQNFVSYLCVINSLTIKNS